MNNPNERAERGGHGKGQGQQGQQQGGPAEGAVPAPKKVVAKRKGASEGIAHVRATFNNTIVNITDNAGNVVCWGSAGRSGFKGSRKSTPFAAQIAADSVGKAAFDAGVRRVEVHIRGAGNGREAAVRALAGTGLRITAIKDFTSVPHNGCRPPKRRRI